MIPQLVVLISGNGSNLQALIDAIETGDIKAQIALVVSNKQAAFGLERAAKAGIPVFVKTLKSYKDAGKTRQQYDIDLASNILERAKPSLTVLAGFMHILSPDFLSKFKTPVINLHPALPGMFDGARAIERALEAFQKKEIEHTGIMVHKVIAHVDSGDVIIKQNIPILASDTLEMLQERIHALEHLLLVKAVKLILETEVI